MNLAENVSLAFLVVAIQIFSCNAWFLPWSADTGEVAASEGNKVEAGLTAGSNPNVVTDLEEEEIPEGEDIENEANLRCAQHFDRNLRRVLKSLIPANDTRREGRQGEKGDTDELVQSMLNLDFPQVIGPVLKILGSAAASNATAIDENYMALPLALRVGVTDLLKFVVDLIELEGETFAP